MRGAHRFRVVYLLLGGLSVVAIAAAVAAALSATGPRREPTCRPTIRTTRWTATGATRADTLAQGILVLGIHAREFRLAGDADRALAVSPLGSVAVRRTGPDAFRVLGLTVIAPAGCEREAAEQALQRLSVHVAR